MFPLVAALELLVAHLAFHLSLKLIPTAAPSDAAAVGAAEPHPLLSLDTTDVLSIETPVFSPEEELALEEALLHPEVRLLLTLLPCEKGERGLKELNKQSLPLRLCLKKVFNLADRFRQMDISIKELGCLRLLILLKPGTFTLFTFLYFNRSVKPC